jgi:hypothetical protein
MDDCAGSGFEGLNRNLENINFKSDSEVQRAHP